VVRVAAHAPHGRRSLRPPGGRCRCRGSSIGRVAHPTHPLHRYSRMSSRSNFQPPTIDDVVPRPST
jgi:hypothetical protein